MNDKSPAPPETSSFVELSRMAWAFSALIVFMSYMTGFEHRAFDSYVHMFFADHYRTGWFDVWEPRWYRGFDVTSYPPLAHQLVGIASLALGLEKGFVTITALAFFLTQWGIRKLAQSFGFGSAVSWAAWLLVLWPTWYRFAFIYGQLPTLLATGLALNSVYVLSIYLKRGGLEKLLLFSFGIAATAGVHHVTTIFAAGLCALVVIFQLLNELSLATAVQEKGAAKRKFPWAVLLRVALAGVCAAGGLYLAILPFWKFAKVPPQVEIPHVSRDPLWERPHNLEWIEHLLMAPFALVCSLLFAVRRQWRKALLASAIVVLGILSWGGTTPLPRILFKAQWRWLTYDKFHVWTSVLFVLLLAILVTDLMEKWAPRFPHLRLPHLTAVALAVFLMPLSTMNIGHKMTDALQPAFVEDISGPLGVFNSEGAERYRHLTLGFGDQFCRFSIYGKSPNVDGDYHTARSDEVLRNSGLGTLDASKYYTQGTPVLNSVLSRADDLHLKWVLLNDNSYYQQLLESGFEIKDIWTNGMTLFEKEDVPPIPDPPKVITAYWWGIVPPGCLAAFALLALALRKRLA